MAIVAAILGLLVVIQLRAQSAGSGLDTLSAQELTVLVANLNTRNDQIRGEIATTETELTALKAAQARGDTSVDQLTLDLARVRAWAGLDSVTGSGIRVSVAGPIAGAGIQDLLNELRNAGAEALAIEAVRAVPGTVVAGEAEALSVDNTALVDPFEISAIGNPATLTGSLTRAGGIVAQLAATFPDATLTVVPIETLQLPATTRNLDPIHGQPRL
jgi:uncharacterized protein YlxW (UPF0749 family)